MNERNFNPLTARQMNVAFAEICRDVLNRAELFRREMTAYTFKPHGKIIWLFLAHKAAFFLGLCNLCSC